MLAHSVRDMLSDSRCSTATVRLMFSRVACVYLFDVRPNCNPYLCNVLSYIIGYDERYDKKVTMIMTILMIMRYDRIYCN